MTCPECGLEVAGREVVTVGALFGAALAGDEVKPETTPQPFEHTAPCGLTCAYGAGWGNLWKALLGKLQMHPTGISGLRCPVPDCPKGKPPH